MVRILGLQTTCYEKAEVIQVSLQVDPYIINELKGCGEIFFELYMPVLPIVLPRVNSSLRHFKEAWNNHPLSSEHYLTPIQFWISGLSHVMLPDLESLTEVIILVLSVLFMDFITL